MDQNRWQSGSGYNIQQYFHDLNCYNVLWKKHCELNGYSHETWGKGAASHDRMCESLLRDTFGADLHVDTVTELNRTLAFMRALHMLLLVLCVSFVVIFMKQQYLCFAAFSYEVKTQSGCRDHFQLGSSRHSHGVDDGSLQEEM